MDSSDSQTPLSPRFVAFARRYREVGLCSFPTGTGRAPAGLGVVLRSPDRKRVTEMPGPPKFLGAPDAYMPGSSTPARTSSPTHSLVPRCCLPPKPRRRLSQHSKFRSSITKPARSLCTLRSPDYSGPTQHSVLAAGLLCQAGFDPLGRYARFQPLWPVHGFLLAEASLGARFILSWLRVSALIGPCQVRSGIVLQMRNATWVVQARELWVEHRICGPADAPLH